MPHSKLVLASFLLTGAILVAPHATGAEETVTASLANLKIQMDGLESDLSGGKLDRVHHFAEAINEAVKDLDKDPSLDDAKRKRVQGYVKNIAKLTDATHDAADERNLAETRKQEKRLEAQVDLLAKQFGKPAKQQTNKPDSISTQK
ncbi:MAG TPA: hypothetical protein VJ385_14495 [Fibrobacteria bacterium]|nr:hypothetical protein [Fibrobacteria bacterium]